MLKRFKIPLIALAAFVIGTLNPLGWAYLRLAEWKLPEIKAESLAVESPFSKVSQDLWVAQSDNAFVINDIKPIAPVHLLVIPKQRYTSMLDVPPAIRAEMIELAISMAKQRGIDESGFRLVMNTNPQGGQTVYHAHIHVIGGRQMGWLG